MHLNPLVRHADSSRSQKLQIQIAAVSRTLVDVLLKVTDNIIKGIKGGDDTASVTIPRGFSAGVETHEPVRQSCESTMKCSIKKVFFLKKPLVHSTSISVTFIFLLQRVQYYLCCVTRVSVGFRDK